MSHQRPALDFLNDIGRGKLARELTDALHELNTACLETGKKGQLRLTLTVEPDKDAPEERFRVTPTVEVKSPKLATRPSLFFITTDGNLTRQDPRGESFESLRGLDPLDGDNADTTTSRKAN